MDQDRYDDLLYNSVRGKYCRSSNNEEGQLIDQEKDIAMDLALDDRIEVFNRGNGYITVKDHKPGFMNNPKFRLINPTKAELGMVSKQMLEEIITAVKTKTQL